MMDPQLLEYIARARRAGIPEQQIQQTLLNVGWPAKDVADALIASSPTPPVTTMPRSVPVLSAYPEEPAQLASPENPQPTEARMPMVENEPSPKKFPLKLTAVGIIMVAILGGGYFVYATHGVPAQVRGVWDKMVTLVPFLKTDLRSLPSSLPTVPPEVSTTKTPEPSAISPATSASPGLAKFASEEEFKDYLQRATQYGGGMGGSFLSAGRMIEAPAAASDAMGTKKESSGAGGLMPDRVSQTNVQVQGIDEPDIVKTDGKEIYFSQKFSYSGYAEPLRQQMGTTESMPVPGVGILPPDINQAETKIFKAFPPAELAKRIGINKIGNLLLIKNILVIIPTDQYSHASYYGGVLQNRNVYGYDVSDPANPKEAWKIELKDATGVTEARLFKNKLYLIIQNVINFDRPCPIVPMIYRDAALSIPCTEIYHPIDNVSVDASYTAMAVNPADGKIESRVSFVSPSQQTILYMSLQALYLTYPLPVNMVGIYYGFFKEKGLDLIPAAALERLRKLQDYDISDASKMTELVLILQQYQAGLSADARLKVENELTNRAKEYFTRHAREMQKTAVVKIDLANFTITAQGEVPGTVLNQFSMDEYKNYLRIATTMDGQSGFWGFGFGGTVESANDILVLDSDLRMIGSVQDLGLTEHIYSARFVEDKGYIVTFRQTDPLYVLDLSIPAAPRKVGELKIPGFSSYLHPITKDLILGVGQENSQVKLSLFDVTNPANPIEKDKYNLNEYWTQVSQTHHAFLLDDKHKVFFMPGSKGGYIFSYAESKLKLVATLADVSAERALYINDYLYIIANNKIVVFNEQDWTQVSKLEF